MLFFFSLFSILLYISFGFFTLGYKKINEVVYKANKIQILEELFKFRRFETRNRKFTQDLGILNLIIILFHCICPYFYFL